MLEYTLLFDYCFCVSVHYIYYNLTLLFSFVKKPIFSPIIIFPLKLRLPITTNLVYLLLVYYILEKWLPVEVWVKDKPYHFFVEKYFIIVIII